MNFLHLEARPLLGWVTYAIGIGLFSPFPLVAADEDIISFSEIATIQSDVIVPVPSEIFNVLDKFSVTQSQWADEIAVPTELDCRDRTHTALFMGSVVAEGFLAVEAEDRSAINKLGRMILDLADSLGMRQAVLKHSNSIVASANDNDWKGVREEFDATRQTVREVMEERRDEDLGHFVSIGGWLRGTEIVTSIISKNYTVERAEILHQPDLLVHFVEMLKRMPAQSRNLERTQRLREGVEDLSRIMSKKGTITEAEVERIHQICEQLAVSTIKP